MAKEISDKEYFALLEDIKRKVQQARSRAYLAVNENMIKLYWEIGKTIDEKQEKEGWGTKISRRLSKDLKEEIPESKSFSVRNLDYMLKFYRTYPDFTILQQVVAKLPWGQNIAIMEKIESPKEREYYLRSCIEYGWSRSVLIHQIESGLFERDLDKNKQHNFERTLPANLAEQAQEALKDQYNLEFLGIQKQVKERELESRMLEKIRDVLLELGVGFAFLGSQYKVKLEEDEYFIDLLFFHRILKCLVAVELKVEEFIPEFAGKMNFYLNLLDDSVKLPDENPSIGILLCKSKKRTRVEFALKGIDKPMGVSEYYLTKRLPKELKGKFPEPHQLQKTLREEEPVESKKFENKKIKGPSLSKISRSQAQEIKKLVDRKTKSRSQKMKLWTGLRKKFGVKGYRDLSAVRFDEALEWIRAWENFLKGTK